MKLNELHEDVERYLLEDCYCPNEVYSVDGFFYRLVYGDAECKPLGKYNYKGEQVYLVATFAEEDPILLTVWESSEGRIRAMERYDLTENNISEIQAVLSGKKKSAVLSENDKLAKDLYDLLSISNIVMV